MTDSSVIVDRDIILQIRNDAREARDGMLRLTAVMGEQNVPEKLTQLRSEMREQHRELRSDLVNAIDRSRAEFKEADKDLAAKIEGVCEEIKPLKEDYDRRTGGHQAFRAIKDWGAFFVAVGGSMIAYVAAKGGHVP